MKKNNKITDGYSWFLKSISIEEARIKAQNRYKPKSYTDAYMEENTISIITSYILQIVIIVFSYSFVKELVSTHIDLPFYTEINGIIVICITVVFLALLELNKRKLLTNFFVSYFYAVRNNKTPSYKLFAIDVVLISISVWLVVKGAENITNHQINKLPTIEKEYQALTSQIKKSHELQLNQLSQEQDRLTKQLDKRTWGLTSQELKQLENINSQKEAIQKTLSEELQEALQKRDKQITQNGSEVNQKGGYIIIFALLAELLVLVCIYNIELYNYRSFLEKEKIKASKAKLSYKREDPPPTISEAKPTNGEQKKSYCNPIPKLKNNLPLNKIGFVVTPKVESQEGLNPTAGISEGLNPTLNPTASISKGLNPTAGISEPQEEQYNTENFYFYLEKYKQVVIDVIDGKKEPYILNKKYEIGNEVKKISASTLNNVKRCIKTAEKYHNNKKQAILF